MLHYKFHQSEKHNQQLLIMLHGFISDQHSFDQHIQQMTNEVNVLTIDLPGHGEDMSDVEQMWDFDFICKQLDHTLQSFSEYQLFLHGYSMGGRVAMYYAIHGLLNLQGLILESTSPGLEDVEERHERQIVDHARAKVLDIAGLEIFVNDWEKLPLFHTQYNLDKERKQQIRAMRLRQNPARLAKALREYGTGQMPNLWPQLTHIQIPICVIVGRLDGKFCKIAQRMITEITNIKLHEVENSGHTVHVEEMAEFDRIVLGFIHKEEQND